MGQKYLTKISLWMTLFTGILIGTPSVQALTYAAFVMDAHTGKVFHAHNSQTPVHPASLTKMMTLFILFEELEKRHISLASPIKFSAYATHQSPSKLGVAVGHHITAKEAMLSLLTRSANDVAVAVAETVSGSERAFVERMNRTALSLGMYHTHFRNPHGLPNKHQITTARDMARLSQALLKRFPNYYRYFSTKTFNYKGQKIHNHNKLLGKVEGLDGIKTGFTCASGYNIATSATRDGRRLIGVVMGGETSKWRNTRVSSLLETAFSQVKNEGINAPLVLVKQAKEDQPEANTIDWEKIENTNDLIEIPAKPVVKAQVPIIMPTASRTWFVQIGTYKNAKEAQKNASKILAALPKNLDSKIFITPAKRKKNKLYQARLGSFDKTTALKISKSLRKKGISCLVNQQI